MPRYATMPDKKHLNESLRKIAKGAGIGFAGTFIGLVLGYFSRMVIARFLGPGDYGLISLGYAGMLIAVTLSSVGLPEGIKRYISFYKGKGDVGRIKGTIIGALKISVPLSLFLALLFFFYADWISIRVFHDAELTPILKIFAIGVPFLVLAQNFWSAAIGFHDLRCRVYVNDLFQNIFKLFAIVSLLLLGFGVIGAAWGWVLAVILMPFLAFYFLEKKVFPIFNTNVKAISMERMLFYFSYPLIFAGLAGAVSAWTDTIMLGYFCTSFEVGIYNAAQPTAKLIGIGSGAFATIFMPVVSELYARNKVDDLRNVFSIVTKWIFSITLPIFLLMSLFSEEIINIMFGSDYIIGASALRILAFSYFITSLFGLAAPLLQSYGRTRVIMGCGFIGAFVNFILNFLLIPLYGVSGAAVATGISTVFVSAIFFLSVYLIGRMQPFGFNYLKPVVASMIAVSVVYTTTKYVIGVSVLSLIVMCFLFLIIYFFLLLIFKSFEEGDLMIMRAMDERLGLKSDWIRRVIKKFL